jgi:phage gp36-like protein
MSWATLTEVDLKTAMTSLEREIFGKTVVDGALTDRVPGILQDVTALVRSYIATCDRNILSLDTTMIPLMTHHHALAIARWRVLTSIPKYNPGEPRKEEYTEAIKFLEGLAKCSPRPPAPLVPATTITTAPTFNRPMIVSNAPRFSRAQQDGI